MHDRFLGQAPLIEWQIEMLAKNGVKYSYRLYDREGSRQFSQT
jgi:NDP-sugar pyrophosphorylase family protein